MSATSSAAPRASAYPIRPTPLRLLVQESEFIVAGHVRESGFDDPDDEVHRVARFGGVNPALIVLVVDGVLKGSPGTRKIQMVCLTGVICPAPAEFPVGRRILAFLDRADNGWDFRPHAASYSTKTLVEGDDDVWLIRVREQLEIDRIQDDAERLAAQVEWLVKCAEDPITRWEGAYELGRAGDPMADYDDSPDPGFAGRTTPEQKSRLLEALLHSNRSEDGEECLEELLAGTQDPRLLRRLVGSLRRVGPERWAREVWTGPLLSRIARCDGRPEIARLLSRYELAQESRYEHGIDEADVDAACRSVVEEFLKPFE